MQSHTITVPAGYRAVLVPDATLPPAPNYSDCAEAATEATGLPPPDGPWLNIFVREINRWCYQAYNTYFQTAEEGKPEPNPNLRKLFEVWRDSWMANREGEELTAESAFLGALSMLAFHGKLPNGADMGVLKWARLFVVDEDGSLLGANQRQDQWVKTGIRVEPNPFALFGEMLFHQIQEHAPDPGSTKSMFTLKFENVGEAEDKTMFFQDMLKLFVAEPKG